MRIGILQTDSVMERFRGRHGDYPQMFMDVLRGAAEAVPCVEGASCEEGVPLEKGARLDEGAPLKEGALLKESAPLDEGASLEESAPLEFATIDTQAGAYPAPGACDAYLITGSRHSVYDEAPWIGALAEFVGQTLDAGSKVVGICFGHQLIAHFFGGLAEPAPGWAVGVHQSRIVADAPWLDPKMDQFGLLSSHKDQVTRMPEGAELIATNEFCPIAGFTWGDDVLTFQGHPEFRKPYSMALMNMRRELLGEDTYQAGMRSLAEDIHASTVGRWILKFCRE